MPASHCGFGISMEAATIYKTRQVVDESDVLSSLDAPMRIEIYKARPEINAIVHSHAGWSTIFAITGKTIQLVDAEMDKFLGGEVIYAEYAEVGTEKLGNNVVKALGKNKFVALMRNHGAVCIGKNFEEAFNVSYFLEKNAKTVLFGNLLGGAISYNKIEYSPEYK